MRTDGIRGVGWALAPIVATVAFGLGAACAMRELATTTLEMEMAPCDCAGWCPECIACFCSAPGDEIEPMAIPLAADEIAL